ncbi:hypothetical protein CSQ88_19870 [Iodobacter sp. BJB302]|nr:hypothetical protein CSQ88_19870 [Iodobacter sp. BJB302]
MASVRNEPSSSPQVESSPPLLAESLKWNGATLSPDVVKKCLQRVFDGGGMKDVDFNRLPNNGLGCGRVKDFFLISTLAQETLKDCPAALVQIKQLEGEYCSLIKEHSKNPKASGFQGFSTKENAKNSNKLKELDLALLKLLDPGKGNRTYQAHTSLIDFAESTYVIPGRFKTLEDLQTSQPAWLKESIRIHINASCGEQVSSNSLTFLADAVKAALYIPDLPVKERAAERTDFADSMRSVEGIGLDSVDQSGPPKITQQVNSNRVLTERSEHLMVQNGPPKITQQVNSNRVLTERSEVLMVQNGPSKIRVQDVQVNRVLVVEGVDSSSQGNASNTVQSKPSSEGDTQLTGLTFVPLGKGVTESYLKSAFFQPKFNGKNNKATPASAAHVLVTDIREALQLITNQEVNRNGEKSLQEFLTVRNTFLPVNVRDTKKDYLAPMSEDQWGILLAGLNQHPQVADIKARVLSMARLTSIAAPRQWLKDSIVPRMLQWAGREVVSLTSIKGANDLKPVASVGQRPEERHLFQNSDAANSQAQDMVSHAQNVTESLGELSAKGDTSFGFKPWVQPRITDFRLKSDTKVSEAFFLAAIRGLLTPMNAMPMSDVEKTFVLARNTLLPVSQVKRIDDAGLTQSKKDEYLAVLKEAIAHRNVKGHAKNFAEIMLRDTALAKSSNSLIKELINELGVEKTPLPVWNKPREVILTQDGLHLGRFLANNGVNQRR